MTAETAPLPDIQSTQDPRNMPIHRVGVTSVSYPIAFLSVSDAESVEQSTVAEFNMFVDLPADCRGTHMSRFTQSLRDWQAPFSLASLSDFCDRIRTSLDSSEARVSVRFPWFVDRLAPVTSEAGKLRLEVAIEVVTGSDTDAILTVTGPATSLCPCSKEISKHGAHNQRSELTVSIRPTAGCTISIEELFELMESSASAQVFPVLKRPDEKWVTEAAYDKPGFVEDMVRDMAVAFSADDRIAWFRCSSENFESIHQHNAYAEIER